MPMFLRFLDAADRSRAARVVEQTKSQMVAAGTGFSGKADGMNQFLASYMKLLKKAYPAKRRIYGDGNDDLDALMALQQ